MVGPLKLTPKLAESVPSFLQLASLQTRVLNLLLVKWHPPPPIGKFKPNIDGASKGNPGIASCGRMIRNYDVKFVCGCSCHLGHGTNIFAELSALKYNLLLYYQLQSSELVAETDSLLAVNWFNKKQEPPWKYLEMWHDILRFYSLFPFELTDIYTGGNSLTDALANLELLE